MFFSKADMGLTRRQEKCVFPISACKLTGGLHFSVQGVHDGTFLGIEFPVPVEVYAAVVFNVQRAPDFTNTSAFWMVPPSTSSVPPSST